MLTILEEKELVEDYILASLNTLELEVYLRLEAASPAVKKAIEEALSRKTAAAGIQANRLATEARLAELNAEQGRVRENLQALQTVKRDDLAAEENRKASRELVRRYRTKLGQLEGDIEQAARGSLEKLKLDEVQANQQLEAFLQGLRYAYRGLPGVAEPTFACSSASSCRASSGVRPSRSSWRS